MIFLKHPKIIRLSSCFSTNNYAKVLCGNEVVEDRAIVLTYKQTEGRGQMGNVWESEDDKNLTFSQVLYTESVLPAAQFIISKAVSLAIRSFVSMYVDKPVKIKWPNDIYVEDNKIAGILIENNLSGNTIANSIIGIGVNINQIEFSKKLPNPTSLKTIANKEFNTEKCLKKLIQELDRWYGYMNSGSHDVIHSSYLENLYNLKEWRNYTDGKESFIARIINIEDSGKLILEMKNGGNRSFGFKEVFIKH